MPESEPLASLADGPSCPAPHPPGDRVQLGHGSGGKLSAALLHERFLPHLANDTLDLLDDGAAVSVSADRLVLSTDSFVVSPLEFPGGNIGSLAVHGTLNDVSMMGAEPRYLTAAFILEEGLPFAVLERVTGAMAEAAHAAGVPVIAGDTKVVERGKADGLFINTTGVGELGDGFRPAARRARSGDAVLVSGSIGRHGMAVMAAREGFRFEVEITSDAATLDPLVRLLRDRVGDAVHTLRDPTRGGVASALNDIAAAAGIGIVLEDGALPIPEAVAAACTVLGLDPLYVANEGIMVAFVAPDAADAAVAALRNHPLGAQAVRIGTATHEHRGLVVLKTGFGGSRVVDMLPGDQLPRIC
jgi:hydrogenase expression/formation protein HypE